MIEFNLNNENGDVAIKTRNGMIIIDEADRDELAARLAHTRDQDRSATTNAETYQTRAALQSKLALHELMQDQEYWRKKWLTTNTRAMNEYINYHTADKARNAAMRSDLEIDDLLLF